MNFVDELEDMAISTEGEDPEQPESTDLINGAIKMW
jgi:hypothetical protein